MQFKIETHLHTHKYPIEEIIKIYKKAGYNTIIITNHYNTKHLDKPELLTWDDKIDKFIEGYKAAQQFGDIYNINILLGMEITLKQTGSDYLIYGVTEEFLRNNPHLHELSLENLYKLCVNNQFLIIQAHPFRENIELAPKKYIMGIEIYNGNLNAISKNEIAEEYATKNNLIGTSGSDFHKLPDLARGGIITNYEVKKIQDYINSIKNNEFKIIKTSI